MRYKIIILISLVCFLSQFFTSATPAAADQTISIVLDGFPLSLVQPPVLYKGYMMVPFTPLAEGLGATIYNISNRRFLAVRANTEVTIELGLRQAIVNGEVRHLEVAPVVIGGAVMVPLRFLVGALGAEMQWYASESSVKILSRTGGESPQEDLAMKTLITGQRLKGTMIGRNGRNSAIVQLGRTSAIIHDGDEVDGYRVDSITKSRVVLTKHGEKIYLSL